VSNTFSPSAVVGGVVIGTIFDATFSTAAVAVWNNNKMTIGPAGFATVANKLGVIGGTTPSSQAALFLGNSTTIIPLVPGEVQSTVAGLSVLGLALVQSYDASFNQTYAYYLAGTETAIDFGVTAPIYGGYMNDLGFVAATREETPTDPHTLGVRYSPITRKSTLLPPYSGDPTDALVLVQGINDQNEVLGYSFTQVNTPYHERIGVWDASGVFHPYYYETLNTSMLVFNDLGQIVITSPPYAGPGFGTSYLLPKPGTRLDLANLVVNLPAGLSLDSVVSIDDEGKMAGVAADASYSNLYPFLLVPLADGDECGEVNVHGYPFPGNILEILRKRFSHK